MSIMATIDILPYDNQINRKYERKSPWCWYKYDKMYFGSIGNIILFQCSSMNILFIEIIIVKKKKIKSTSSLSFSFFFVHNIKLQFFFVICYTILREIWQKQRMDRIFPRFHPCTIELAKISVYICVCMSMK